MWAWLCGVTLQKTGWGRWKPFRWHVKLTLATPSLPASSSPPQTWLLGYEFPSTLILFSKDGTVTFLCSPSKGPSEPAPSHELPFSLARTLNPTLPFYHLAIAPLPQPRSSSS